MYKPSTLKGQNKPSSAKQKQNDSVTMRNHD